MAKQLLKGPIKYLIKMKKKNKYRKIRERIDAVILRKQKKSFSNIGDELGHPPSWAHQWYERYLEAGIEGLFNLSKSGQPKKLDEDFEAGFIGRLANGPLESDGVTSWNSSIIQNILMSEYGASYSISGVKNLLRRLGFSYTKPRPKHEKNDPNAMKTWREETLPAFYDEVQSENPKKKIEVWYQDEARFGEKTRINSTWQLKGAKNEVVKQLGFRTTYLYGAVNPLTGQHSGFVCDECSTEVTNIYLEQISACLHQNTTAIVVWDGAGWHSNSKDLVVPSNIRILDLPPYSPQLNPVERVWLWLKKKYFSNLKIEKSDCLLDVAGDVWNKLTPERIKSLCRTRDLAFID